MRWWQTLLGTLSTLIVSKAFDPVVSSFAAKRQFDKLRREMAFHKIGA